MKKMKVWIAIIVILLVLSVIIVLWSRSNDSNKVTIGAIMPLTGDVASYGIAIKQGVELAVHKVNQEGGINGLPIVVLYEDSRADPKEGVAVAKKLISINRVRVIIGAVASSVTLAVAPVAEQLKVVLISPASSSPKITNAGDYIFRNYPSDELEGQLVAKFAIEKKYLTAGVLTINNDYGTGLNKVFTETYRAAGGEISINERYSEGTNDFRTLLTKVKQKEPQCIFIVGYGRELGTLVKHAKELGVSSQFLSTVNFYDAQSLESGGTAVDGVIFSSPVFDPKAIEPNVIDFVAAFKERFHKEPDVWSAHGYDALLLVVEAMRRTNGIDAEKVREGLYTIKDFPGVSGRTTFDNNGDVVKDARFLTVRKSEFVPY